jgi:endonuclease-8
MKFGIVPSAAAAGATVPEGPEIRRAADRIARVLVGERIESAEFTPDRLRGFGPRMSGTTVRAVDTRGKAMLTRFDNDLTLYSHNQLYGRWFVVRRGATPNTGRSLRVALHTGSHSALLYSASDIEVLTEYELGEHPFLSRLGPDILDADLDPGAVVERLQMPRFRRRSLAALYLDQSFLAGLGNYLRSEILFCARLHPMLKPLQMEGAALKRLARETLKISSRSYATGGVTLPKSQLPGAGERRKGRRERFWVFARAGRPCRRCRSAVKRENRAGRRLYHCPACQAAPAA